MDVLFPDARTPDDPADASSGSVVAVAVNANVWGEFDYRFPEALGEPVVGLRVRVPFGRGNTKTLGFVTELNRTPGSRVLKCVTSLVDDDGRPAMDGSLLELGRWISQYYLSPIGMTLAAMVPSSVGQSARKTETVLYLRADNPNAWPDRLGHKQRVILDELLEARRQGVEPLTLEQVLHHAEAGRDTIHRLLKRGLVRQEHREVVLPDLSGEQEADPFELNDDQRRALDELSGKLGDGFGVSLLHGVTGSGKTEVYVRAIREVIAQGRQAILLAPEIALATQTLQRLLTRLPRVAVLHSGLTATERAYYWDQIRQGRADVVVGPRSAIFAPTPNLGLVIVDEEHEGSYKQDTAPRYHGRDVAIKRAQLAGAAVVLGSATPSMESLQNARQGRYDLLRLRSRVRDLPMPRLEIVHLRREMSRGRIELIGVTLTQRIASTLDRGEQTILLMNRRGYASYVFCPKCQWMLDCDDCLRPMVYHQAIQLCICHHCNRTGAAPEACPACGGRVILFGYGIQRIEDELARKFPVARIARMDSDTMTSPKQFQKVLGEFASGEIDILLGTQMVAKGLDFPKVTLVGIASADTSLAVSDFRASERTFQLIVQVAGRAGRGGAPGNVVVQTLHAEDPAIQFAETHDYDGFAELELQLRSEANLPPFARVVRFIVRHTNVATANQGAVELAGQLRALLPPDMQIIGPQQAEFAKLRNHYRFQVLLIGPRAGVVQRAIGSRMESITRSITADIQADVDPLNLL